MLFVWLLVFFIYLRTLCPTLFGGDSGELISASFVLGFSHPPGFPLYMIIGKLFSFLPFKNIAYRYNLMSCFFSSVSSIIIYKIYLLFKDEYTIPYKKIYYYLISLCTLIFCFSYTFWYYSTFAEVYTLAFFLYILSFYFLLKFTYCNLPKYNIYLSFFLLGLSICAHPTGYLFILGYLYLSFNSIQKLRIKDLIICSIFIILGLSVFLYLPLRISSSPQINWGNISCFKDLLSYLKARIYTFNIFIDFYKIKKYLLNPLRWILYEFKLLNSMFIFIGFLYLFKKHLRLAVFSSIVFICIVLFSIFTPHFELSIDKKAYFLFFYFLCSFSIFYLFLQILNYTISKRYLSFISLGILTVSFIFQFINNYLLCDKSRNTFAYDYNKKILNSLDKQSIIFVDNDWVLFGLAYLKIVEKQRKDVILVDRNRNLFTDFYKFTKKYSYEEALLQRDIIEERFIRETSRPVYFNRLRKFHYLTNKELINWGLVYKVVDKNRKSQISIKEFNFNYPKDINFHKDPITSLLIGDYYSHLATFYMEKGDAKKFFYYMNLAYNSSKNSYDLLDIIAQIYSIYHLYPQALKIYLRMISLFDYIPYPYRNAGMIYALIYKDYCQASRYLKRYIKMYPQTSEKDFILEIISKCKRKITYLR